MTTVTKISINEAILLLAEKLLRKQEFLQKNKWIGEQIYKIDVSLTDYNVIIIQPKILVNWTDNKFFEPIILVNRYNTSVTLIDEGKIKNFQPVTLIQEDGSKIVKVENAKYIFNFLIKILKIIKSEVEL